jgi:hypothetical protein
MTPEIAALVELLARSVYVRWRAGELELNAEVQHTARVRKDHLPGGPIVAYDRQSNVSSKELLGCASTPTPVTARNGKQKPR